MRTRRIVLLIVALALALIALTGCFIKRNGTTVSSSYTYSSAANYNVGPASVDASKISELEVDWVSGSIKVVYGRVRAIEIDESVKKGKISEDEQLRWIVEGGKLRIKFAKSGLNLISNLNKDLVITVPEGIVFKKTDIDSVSADATVEVASDAYEFDQVSGDVTLTSDWAGSVDVDSVSGKAVLTFSRCPSSIEVGTVSGDAVVRIPANSGFKLKFDTVSGKMDCSIPATVSGKEMVAGDGKAGFKFDSVSGDVKIESI